MARIAIYGKNCYSWQKLLFMARIAGNEPEKVIKALTV